LKHTTDSENLAVVNKLIEEVTKKQKNLRKIKDESVEKIAEVVKQLSVILGIPTIASALWEGIQRAGDFFCD
jgi:hypothetical protein